MHSTPSLRRWCRAAAPLALLAPLWTMAAAAPAQEQAMQTAFVVAPTGDDRNDGTESRPFATPARAQEALRQRIAAGLDADATVLLRAGTYALPDGLAFDARDSGTESHAVTWRSFPGEVARLVGGVRLTGWQPHDGAIETTTLPEGVQTRRLIENGESLEIARHPNTDYFFTESVPDDDRKRRFAFRAGDFDPAGWDLTDATLLIWPGHPWFSYEKRVEAIDPSSREVRLGDDRGYAMRTGGGDQYYLRNILAILDRPGEAQIAHSKGRVYVWPRGGKAADREIIATTAPTLLRIEGTSDAPVRNLHFADLDLVGADGDLVRFSHAYDCSVRNSRLAAARGIGVHVNGAAERVTLYGNLIEDHGGHGVRLAGLGYGEDDLNHHHTVENNHIRRCGYAEGPGYGIEIAWSGHNRVLHNHIHDMPRYGTSIKGTHAGKLEGEDAANLELRLAKNHSRNNRFAFNHIHHVNLESQDTGAMESWGSGRDNVYDHNLIHDTGTPRWDTQQGIYLDDGSHYFTITNNIIYNVHGRGGGIWCIFAKGIGHRIENNILIAAPPVSYGIGSLAMAGEETHHHRYLRNIIVFTGGADERSDPKAVFAPIDRVWDHDRIVESDHNLVYDAAGDPLRVRLAHERLSWDAWREILDGRYDQDSLVADPEFVDPANHDYRLQPDSPAFGLGFEPIDVARIGLKDDFPERLPRE